MIYAIFHALGEGNFCTDGLFAAYAFSLKHPEALLMPQAHPFKVSPIVPNPGDQIFCLDIAPPRSIAKAWKDAGAEVIVLDHHPLNYSLEDLALHNFDKSRSGAVITWQYCFPGHPVPEIFRYVQDRDLWTKALPDCDRISLGIREYLYGKSLEEALEICHGLELEEVLEMGQQAEAEIEEAIVSALARHSTRCVLSNVVPYVKVKTQREAQVRSEIGNRLSKLYPKGAFAVVQCGEEGWALRGPEARKYALMMGGNGHPQAAGCRAELPW